MSFNDILNDDCVFYIFSYLYAQDLLETEKVCKKWAAWTASFWHRLKKVNDHFIKLDDICLEDDTLENIFSHCTGNVQELVISEFYDYTECLRFLTVVTRYCNNVQVLVLTDMTICTDSILLLANTYTELRKLTLELYIGIQEYALSILFGSNKNLQYVSISFDEELSGECLKSLPSILKEFHLRNSNFGNKYVKDCIKKCPSIEALTLNSCDNLTTECVEDILKSVPKLNVLFMNRMNVSLTPLKYLKHLRELHLFRNRQVDDEIMKMICESCLQLEELRLGAAYDDEEQNVTTVGLMYLSGLPRLRKLNLRYVSLTLECLKVMLKPGTLRELKVMECEGFDDLAALQVFSSCKDLRLLDINQCDVTVETVKNAVVELGMQTTRNEILTLKMYTQVYDFKAAAQYTHRLLRTYVKIVA